MLEVQCCCNPNNLLEYLPEHSTVLPKREREDGSWAFSADGFTIGQLSQIHGFIASSGSSKKTWKDKTWKKK